MKWIQILVTLTILVGSMPGYIAASPSSTIVYYKHPMGAFFILNRHTDTLKGYIFLSDRPFFQFYPLPHTLDVRYLNIQWDSVGYMKLYDDSINCKAHFRILERIDDKGLWRLVGKKSKVSIYDGALVKGACPGSMLLVTPDATVKIFHWANYFILHFGHARPLVLKFINHRYAVRLHEKDFTSKQEMIDYILNKENGLLNSTSFSIRRQ